MTLRTAILWKCGHIKCVQHAVRGVQVKTGGTQTTSKVSVKKEKMIVSTVMGEVKKMYLIRGGAKTAYVDNNGKAWMEIKKKESDVTARDRGGRCK